MIRDHKKLFIPGPVEVHPDILEAMTFPMIAHRGKDYEALHKNVKDKLQRLLFVDKNVFISTSSSTGVMEGGARCLIEKKGLCMACGAFSERWYEIAIGNGKDTDLVAVEWGNGIHPEMVDKQLSTGKYDAMLIVHNETSTGVMNPLEEISKVMKKYPDVMFLVDCVSSMAGVKIEPAKWGIDLCLAGVQKAFGLPPGIAVMYVSDRALEKAKNIKNRGFYFDLVKFKSYDDKNQTPETPSISHIAALDCQLERMFKKGIENVFRETEEKAKFVRAWARKSFDLFPEKGFESVTLTSVKNTLGIDVADLNKYLATKGMVISDGYGKVKGKSFRIAHMADITVEDLKTVTGHIDDYLKTIKR